MWWRGVFLSSDCDVTQKGQQRKPELVPLMCFIYWPKKKGGEGGGGEAENTLQCSAVLRGGTEGDSGNE